MIRLRTCLAFCAVFSLFAGSASADSELTPPRADLRGPNDPPPPPIVIQRDPRLGFTALAGGGIGAIVTQEGSAVEGHFELMYAWEHAAVLVGAMASTTLEFAGGNHTGDFTQTSYFTFFAGGRYYLWDRPFSPYGGIGLGYDGVQFNISPGGNSTTYSTLGIGAYGELGVALFRNRQIGFEAGVRMDAPFYAGTSNHGDKYILPTFLTLSVAFH